MSYIYLKKQPKKKKIINKKKNLAFLLAVCGLLFFSSAIFPIIKFQLGYALKFKQMINPLSSQSYRQNGNILGEMTTDYTQLSNWFESDSSSNKPVLFDGEHTTYTISIPKLKVKEAVVTVGSMDLEKSLIQYPQTALPGQLGNAVVFGHSVLPQFFNPKSYLTIFSTLYKLEEGDEIYVKYGSIEYKYVINKMFEVKPTDLSVLDQRFDQRSLTLITCSPPGTYLRRLVIQSVLVEN